MSEIEEKGNFSGGKNILTAKEKKKKEKKMNITRGCLPFSMFDEDDTRKVNSFSEGLFRSCFPGRFLQEHTEPGKMTEKEFQISLPSDQSWRLKNYFKLLDKQKAKILILHMMPPEDVEDAPKWEQAVVNQPELKRAKMTGSSSLGSEGSVVTSQGSDISWNSLDLTKAATLLGPDSSQVSFQDEDEMRRIFALLYDVFRYKSILNDALRETGFFQKYPQHEENVSLIWLLFYDLHKRRFLPRVHADAVLCAEAFEKVGLTNVENDLWAFRIKLAASLARARIKNNALRLNQLLPPHLRDEKFVSVEETPVTGWINTFQKSKKEIIESIEKLGLKLQSRHETVLTKNDFRFDHLCPKLLLCHPLQRSELAQSPLIRNHMIVLQDRAFCIGPALMGKILTDIPLRGTVAQTHVNTPRTTAYLANVLIENERLDKLVAFGAGDRLLEYQTYLHELGVTNCEIYAQKFAEIHPEAAILENLVAVVATPPNTYTGVTDPVDLICSRGGDMKMLKALTQIKMGEDTFGYLEEQRETLKFCMSLPQVQIILYETHSVAPEENSEMVKSVVETVNGLAKEKHEEAHRLMLEKEEAEEKANKPVFIPGKSSSREQKEKEREAQEAKEAALPKEVEIPPCDLFEIIPLPDLCMHGQECFAEEGCYLARVQRKEIISLDAKYMIKIAEARGLFGTDLGKKKAAPAVRVPKKQERRRTSSVKIKVKKAKLEIERLTAPTQSTLYRTKKESSPFNVCSSPCPRHQSHTLENMNKVIQAKRKMIRQWWHHTYDVILKQIPYKELTPRSRAVTKPPLLRLPRPRKRKAFPLHKAFIEFDTHSESAVLDRILDALNQGDSDDVSTGCTESRRNSRLKKCQEESIRRLSRPIARGSTSPGSFSSEIKPRFWRYATAKSIEDLIRVLRKKRRGKRIFKVEDYFFFKDQGFFVPQLQANSLTGETGTDEPDLDQTIDPNTIYERTIIEPSLQSKKSITNAYFTDVQVIKPFINKDVLRIMSYGTVSARSSTKAFPNPKSLTTINEQNKCSLIQQCMENASIIFRKIDEAIEENKKITERKAILTSEKNVDPYSQKKKFKNKSFSPLEALSKIEEVNNIIDFKKSRRTDIVLPEKYLPGQQTTDEQKEFVKTLQKKLEKLQQSYQYWSKWQEEYSVERLSMPKRITAKKLKS